MSNRSRIWGCRRQRQSPQLGRISLHLLTSLSCSLLFSPSPSLSLFHFLSFTCSFSLSLSHKKIALKSYATTTKPNPTPSLRKSNSTTSSSPSLIREKVTTSQRPTKVKSGSTKSLSSSSLRGDVSSTSSEKQAPILPQDNGKAKEIRESKNKGPTKWMFESPRKDLIEFLSEQMSGQISKELHGLLFSTTHYKEKDFLSGLSLLDDCLSKKEFLSAHYGIDLVTFKQRLVGVSDLLLKYVTLRFFDTNTSMLIKCLDFLGRFFEVLDDESYHLSDYEASSFLPFFVSKVQACHLAISLPPLGHLSLSTLHSPCLLFSFKGRKIWLGVNERKPCLIFYFIFDF